MLDILLEKKLSAAKYSHVIRNKRKGAKWKLADDGVRLYDVDNVLLLYVPTETLLAEEDGI